MKILAIGNSFSDDSMEYLYPVLQALGAEEISLGNLYIGGCPLSSHVEHCKSNAPAYEYRTNTQNEWHTAPNHPILDAVASQEWEIISMQQASSQSGFEETYDVLPKLIEFVRANTKKGIKLAWNMTWAYQQDFVSANFEKYQNDQTGMYQAILQAVKSRILPSDQFCYLFPVGTAIQNARSSYLGDTLTRDGFHLSIPFGRYIAALTWGRVLTGKSVEGISYAPSGVDEALKEIAVESVENAIRSPFAVTQSAFQGNA